LSLTTDPKDPRLGRGVDATPVPQNKAYLVLSDEELAKGFKRPVRNSYRHVGIAGPRYPLRDLTPDELALGHGYVKYEQYPAAEDPLLGRYWTQKQLDSIGQGCGAVTTMDQKLAETYARNPHFYGSTYCTTCRMHLKVGSDGEFVWEGTIERVGT
jgi:hypothetical protein